MPEPSGGRRAPAKRARPGRRAGSAAKRRATGSRRAAAPKQPAKARGAKRVAKRAARLAPLSPLRRAAPDDGTMVRSDAGNTTSTSSPRLEAAWAALDGAMRARFPGAQAVHEYGMRGWKVRRPVTVGGWRGTMDPNWLRIGIAERKQGITLHLWNPYEYGFLQQRKVALERAGFKVMVGCLQFNRKQPFPVEAVDRLLLEVAGAMEQEKPR